MHEVFWGQIYKDINKFVPLRNDVSLRRVLGFVVSVLLLLFLLLLLLLLKMSQQCMARRKWEHTIKPKIQTPHNQPWKEEKEKIVGNKKKEHAD